MSDVELDIEAGALEEQSRGPGANYCHIRCGDSSTAYCGHDLGNADTCGLYQGEAICPTCGLPTCSACAVQSSLHERMFDES